MSFFKKIVLWNQERNLLALGFNHEKEVSFIIEELLESTGRYDSQSARDLALIKASEIVGEGQPEKEVVVDAFADVIVFAAGAIAKLGYDTELVMEEVYQEINSRTGKLVDGKFVKDINITPYKADFSKCLFK